MSTLNSHIFNTVAGRDYLSLFQGSTPKYQGIVQFLEFKKEDVAKATGVPVSSVRYDDKISIELRDRLREWANLFNLVAEYFQGDGKKTVLWFTTPNPLLGNLPPRDMIRLGRYKKLFKFIFNALTENKQ